MSVTRGAWKPAALPRSRTTEEHWQDIGHARRAHRRGVAYGERAADDGGNDVRHIDDMDGPEWSFTAWARISGTGWCAAEAVARRFAPGGLLHYRARQVVSRGVAARWALGCFWRPDGVPVWNALN